MAKRIANLMASAMASANGKRMTSLAWPTPLHYVLNSHIHSYLGARGEWMAADAATLGGGC